MEKFWSPTDEFRSQSQMMQFMQAVNERFHLKLSDYSELHAWSVDQPGDFWLMLWDWCGIVCQQQPTQAFQPGRRMQDSEWMVGARFNFAENVLSRQDNSVAISFTGESGKKVQLSYAELWQQVATVANYFRSLDIQVGDRVCAVVPNYHLTVVCMLATTSLGAVWCSCSPDFGVQSLITRFEQVDPVLLITVDGYEYNGKVYPQAEKTAQLQQALTNVKATMVLPFLEEDFLSSSSRSPDPLHPTSPDLIGGSRPLVQCYSHILEHYTTDSIQFESLPFSHPIYILFSSGTTGKPKCMVHGAGGTLLQHLKEHRLHGDMRPGEKLFFYTTCGWMMWNWAVSILAVGGTLVLYDGSPFYPQQSRLFDLIDGEKINAFGVGAKYLEVCESEGLRPIDTNSLQSLRLILTTGSPLLPASFDYVKNSIKPDVQLSSISGGSDIVSCFFLGNPMRPVYRGELQAPGLGMDMQVYDEQGCSVRNEKGELVCATPFPSMPLYFWNDRDGQRYQTAYFEQYPGVWTHGDYVCIRDNLSVIIYGRSDTTLNPGGVRIGTAEIYQQLESIPEVKEGLAVGQAWRQGERIVLFVVLEDGVTLSDKLIKTIKTVLRQRLSPKHVPAIVQSVPELPKTANGKLVEKVVKRIVNGQSPGDVSMLQKPDCLPFFKLGG